MTSHIINNQLNKIVDYYTKFLPRNSFPWVILFLAACAQFFAWYGAGYFFPNVSIQKRTLYSWLMAFVEFNILIPGIGASVTIIGQSETFLNILYHAFGLTAFFILNKITLKAPFNKRHLIAFILMISAVIIAATADKEIKNKILINKK